MVRSVVGAYCIRPISVSCAEPVEASPQKYNTCKKTLCQIV